MGRLSLLDNNKPIYLTLERKVWILFMVKSIPYSFSLNMKHLSNKLTQLNREKEIVYQEWLHNGSP